MDTEEFSVFERVQEALHPDDLAEVGRRMVYERHQRILLADRQGSNRRAAAPQRLPTRSPKSAANDGPSAY
jgi:hypothetical protein